MIEQTLFVTPEGRGKKHNLQELKCNSGQIKLLEL
jgi:hypothetical protein